MENGLFLSILYGIISLSVATMWGLLMGGIMLKVVARAHGRFGPPFWQPIIDIIKNNARRSAISHGIMYYLGPVFRIAGGMGTFLFIPLIYGSVVFANFSFAGDLFLVMYFIFFGQLGMALGAGESGHPYGAIGVARGLSQMTAFELPFALSIISLIIQYNTLSITEIVALQQGGFLNWTLITNPLATLAALISLQGMNMHNPFSIVIAPQEIPIGPPTEYHSNFLGLLQTNRGLFNIAKLALFMNLYFGGATSLVAMFAKTFGLYLITIVIGTSFPRFRTEQSIRFFLGVPTLIGILAVIIKAYL
jgi:NADH-quinone oxidoreductase subunit H